MVEAVSLHTSLVQTVAAEKVTHVEAHQGDANQYLFAAELAKEDEKRKTDVQTTSKTEAEKKIDPRNKKSNEGKRQQEAQEEQPQADPEQETLLADDPGNHLIDITV